MRIQSALNTNPGPTDILMWLLEFWCRLGPNHFRCASRPRCSVRNHWCHLNKVDFMQGHKNVNKGRIFGVQKGARTKWSLKHKHIHCFKVMISPRPQALWRSCLDGCSHLCRKWKSRNIRYTSFFYVNRVRIFFKILLLCFFRSCVLFYGRKHSQILLKWW